MRKVLLTAQALHDLEKLSADTKRRILVRIREFARDPLSPATELADARIGTNRFRVGDYRVIFDVVADSIVVLRVGHRRDIYR